MADLISPSSPLELQIQQQALDRQRAIATMLQKDSLTPMDGQMVSGHYVAPSPMQYIAKLAQGLIGKNQQESLDQKQLGLAKQYNDNQMQIAQALISGSSGQQPATAPASLSLDAPADKANTSDSFNVPTMPLGSGMSGIDAKGIVGNDRIAQMLLDGSSTDKQPPLGPSGSQTAAGTASTATGDAGTSKQGGNPLFRGMDPKILSWYLQSPDSAFGKIAQVQIQANAKALEPTELIKTMRAAGIDENSLLGKQILQQNVAKQNYIAPTSLRPGGYVQNADGTRQQLPSVPEGYQAVDDGQGGWKIVAVPGGKEAIAGTATAKARGPATFNTQKVWNPKTNQYEYSTAANIADAAGGPPNPPASGSPNFPVVTPQQQRERDARAIEMAKADIANARTPQDKQQAQQAYDTMVARYNAGQSVITGAATASQGGAPVAEPAPGFAESQTALAKEGAKRYNDLLSQASESPVRVNVYDNILNLSRDGVATGPGEQWKNTVKGYTANTPFLGAVAPSKWKDEVTGFQELNKFLYQNAQRNWQAAGGTGTDAQLEAFTRSNPNDKMFPKALQMMAQWGKAGELALQAKANAAQRFKDANGGNIANQDQFERQWRNAFDPRVFQLNIMSPDEQKAFVAKLPPAEAKALLEKRAALRQLGGL